MNCWLAVSGVYTRSTIAPTSPEAASRASTAAAKLLYSGSSGDSVRSVCNRCRTCFKVSTDMDGTSRSVAWQPFLMTVYAASVLHAFLTERCSGVGRKSAYFSSRYSSCSTRASSASSMGSPPPMRLFSPVWMGSVRRRSTAIFMPNQSSSRINLGNTSFSSAFVYGLVSVISSSIVVPFKRYCRNTSCGIVTL